MGDAVGAATFKAGAGATVGASDIGAKDARTGFNVGAMLVAIVVSDIGAFVSMSNAPYDGEKVGEFDGRFVSALNSVLAGAGVTPACAFPKIDTILSNFNRLSSLLVGFPQSWQPIDISNVVREWDGHQLKDAMPAFCTHHA